MKPHYLLIVLFTGFYLTTRPQPADTITLEQCYHQAVENFPLAKQRAMLQQSAGLEIKKLNTQYLPQVALHAQASYQSDVPHVPIESPAFEIPVVPKDQYRATIDVSQVIYDGSATKHQKDIQSSAVMVQQQNVEVQLEQLKSQAGALFFSILLADAQLEINKLLRDNLFNQLEKVQAAVDNGIMISSNADVLRAELIKARQQQETISRSRRAAIAMLAELTGLQLDTADIFRIPELNYSPGMDISASPEYTLFQLQQQTLDLQRHAIISKQLPRLAAFAQGGFGRPGFNLLEPDLKPLYIAGLKLIWSPWHWNAGRYERQILSINKDIITSQREAFDVNSRLALMKQSATIETLQRQLASDMEIIALRQRITSAAAAQLDNGVITATDYLIELNAEQQARLNLKMHGIQLEQAKAEYLLIIGK
ncbi:MAG TPA: TolC family protein [Chitinophagales bacterium]|nr:TolC family protein [Chitinophagales bacterium]